MAAVARHDVPQGGLGSETGEFEIHRQVFPSEDVGILLADVVDRVHERGDMSAGDGLVLALVLLHVDVDTCQIAFRGPGVDEDAHPGLALQEGIEVGDIGLPARLGGPFVDVDGLPGGVGGGVAAAVVAHAEGRHEAHQFHRGLEIGPRNRADELLVAGGIHFRPGGFALGDGQDVHLRAVRRDDEDRSGLVPAVAVGLHADGEFHLHLPLVVGQLDLLQDDASVGEVDDAFRIGVGEPAQAVRQELDMGVVEHGEMRVADGAVGAGAGGCEEHGREAENQVFAHSVINWR